MGVLRVRFSEEEKEEVKQEILNNIDKSDIEIASIVGVSDTTVHKYIEDLIAKNRLTREQLEKAREDRERKEWKKKKAIVLEGVNEGITEEEHRKRINARRTIVKQIIKELEEER